LPVHAVGGRSSLESDFSSDADGESDYSNTMLYTGRTFDPAIGLYYYRHRVFHPQLGRFNNRESPALSFMSPLSPSQLGERGTKVDFCTRERRASSRRFHR